MTKKQVTGDNYSSNLATLWVKNTENRILRPSCQNKVIAMAVRGKAKCSSPSSPSVIGLTWSACTHKVTVSLVARKKSTSGRPPRGEGDRPALCRYQKILRRRNQLDSNYYLQQPKCKSREVDRRRRVSASGQQQLAAGVRRPRRPATSAAGSVATQHKQHVVC